MKILRLFSLILLVLVIIIIPSNGVLAQDGSSEEESPELIDFEPFLDIFVPFPKVEVSDGEAVFDMDLTYITGEGADNRAFDLVATGPQDWLIYMTPNFPKDQRIAAIELEAPSFGSPDTEKIRVVAVPSIFRRLEAGNYPILFEARAEDELGTLIATFELTAVIPATYFLSLTPVTGLYNTKAVAGRNNLYSIEMVNRGSATISDINFSIARQPEGWDIDFSPEEIASLGSAGTQTVELNIQPPPNSIAGDYEFTIKADGIQTSTEMLLRVTVETSSIWGWIGVGLIVLVIVGVIFIFMRFSKR